MLLTSDIRWLLGFHRLRVTVISTGSRGIQITRRLVAKQMNRPLNLVVLIHGGILSGNAAVPQRKVNGQHPTHPHPGHPGHYRAHPG